MKTRKAVYHLHKMKSIYDDKQIISQELLDFQSKICHLQAPTYTEAKKTFNAMSEYKDQTIDWVKRMYTFIWCTQID